jgi:hypothetical protein
VDRLVGFEDLGTRDDFATSVIEARIARSGCLVQKDELKDNQGDELKNSIRVSTVNQAIRDDDEDED